MSGHSASPAHQLRIAIALAALRHKPVDQSYEAYILDVQAEFPLSRPPSDGCKPWRARALLLEKNLKDLQAKYQKDQTELHSLRKAQASGQDRSESPALVGGKKKQKKKTSTNTSSLATAPHRPNLLTILTGGGGGSSILQGSSIKNALGALETLDTLLEMAGEKSAIPDDILIGTTTSALEAIASLLTSVLSQDVYGSSTVEILDALATLLSRLLTTVFPLLSKPKSKRSKKARLERGLAIDNMLGLLSTTILVPLIPSFVRLSVQYLSALFSDNKTSKHAQSHAVVDIRPIVFAFVDKTISLLDELATSGGALSINSHRHVKCLLALQSIRELAKLYPESSRGTAADMNLGETTAAGVQPPHPQPPDRLVRLAKKDAAWYLCNVLHRVLPASPESLPADPSDEQAALLEDAIYTTMSALLRCTRGTAHHKAAGALPVGGVSLGHPFCGTMGEVERGMLLAVVERLWLGM